MLSAGAFFKTIIDIILTSLFWLLFITGLFTLYIPACIFGYIFYKDKESVFQRLNYFFYGIFFSIVRWLTPGLKIEISDDVRMIKSSVVICNHTSYLDPILIISLFPKQKTVVKGVFFKVPIFGWIVKSSGYIPFTAEGEYKEMMIERYGRIKDFLDGGGTFFIFPEGRRGRSGNMGNIKKGAFTIAKKCNVPVEILYINNTDRLFTPGRFLFHTCRKNLITVERLGVIDAHVTDKDLSIKDMKEKAQLLLLSRMNQQAAKPHIM